jgi:hypothetical protein
MAYTLENLSSRKIFTISDDAWLGDMATARENGWEEEGTQYDLAHQIDETYDPMYEYQYNLWMTFCLMREMFEWNGNYIEKNNQIVSESDAYFMMKALEKTWSADDRSFLEFLGSGALRICAV